MTPASPIAGRIHVPVEFVVAALLRIATVRVLASF